jgi:hypothetical protein
VEIKSSSSNSTDNVLVVLVLLETPPPPPPAGDVIPEGGSEVDSDWMMIIGDPRVLSVDSNCVRTGDKTGGNGVGFGEVVAMAKVAAAGGCWAEGLKEYMGVSPAQSSRSSSCEFRLLRLSLLGEFKDPDRLRKPEPPPAEWPRKGEIRPPMRLCINLFGVDGLGG